jgi:alkanesulfonate monooxygenase SsuD/methylene tetrahydromethanopterin reductase-like flavin-dependent oxidoreductase (luciferase family)
VRVYREAAGEHGWEPTGDQLLYRIAVHVGETDDQAREEWAPLAAARGHAGGLRLSSANRAVDDAAAGAGYYGRDAERQRSRLHAGGDIDERIDTAQLMIGAPDTVLGQAARIGRELGAGILELIFVAPSPDHARRSLERFGTQVLPRMREL